MEKKTKAETFVGFAVRARKVKCGMNACATLKRAYLMIVCKSASENTLSEAQSLSKKLRCSLIKPNNELLEDLVHKSGIKVIAITDVNLAQAITSQAKEEFTVIC